MDKNAFLVSSYLGMQFAAVICLFGLGGYWLDGKFGTKPLFLLVCLVLGFFAGMYLIISSAVKKGNKK